MADVEDLARQLYEQQTRCAPEWRQLGDVTKTVWRGMAHERMADGQQASVPLPAAPAQPQTELF